MLFVELTHGAAPDAATVRFFPSALGYPAVVGLVTDYLSGTSDTIGPGSVCVCLRTTWYVFHLNTRSISKVKVVGESHRRKLLLR